MDKRQGWLKYPFGKKLKRLHKWNAWVILLLAITGIMLYLPFLRRYVAPFRVNLKLVHIYLGYVSIFLLLLYTPLLTKHMKQIWKRVNHRNNLRFVLFIIIGWSVSGIILAFYRHFPDVWSSTALIFHDLFTFVGIPYTVYHAISRSRWLKKMDREERKTRDQKKNLDGTQPLAPKKRETLMSRRKFIRLSAGGLLVVAVAPFFYGWLGRIAGFSGESLLKQTKRDGNHMVPQPEPAPGSLPPKGGGANGTFRMYTVTDVPAFSSDTWSFTIDGLVDHPLTFNWKEFLNLPQKVQVSDFHCVTGWSVYHVTWQGVPLSYLLKKAGVKNKAKYVKFYSGDSVYTDTLTIKQAHMDDVMVAVLRDGKPIPQDYGGPSRLIVPEMYGYKSVKWLNRMELIDQPWTGFWEKRGYKKNAWYRG
ncbi:molybdopterin-dependent oxidoreductase [Scopulibacillus darangshiensis]|uniref:molybdopterin-dependent oxidoreductase n=1 Tax=Scopulibacillus darangshiensis TaxID=442528 RepID=UPI001051435F|nr:molybdopterin-dependent oxidoreductase [Scopulibacillus darangshiensis]